MTACPGRCNSAYCRAQQAYEAEAAVNADRVAEGFPSRPPEPHGLILEPGDPVWCRRCATLVRVCLAELDDLAAILEAEAAGQRAPDVRVSGTPGAASPSPRVDDALDILQTLEGWERDYRDHRGWPQPPLRGRTAPRRTGCIAWLADHLDGVLAAPGAADFGAEVLRLHRAATARTATGPDKVRKPIACPRCDRRSLVHKGGAKHVECETDGCGRLLTLEEYDALAEATARAVS